MHLRSKPSTEARFTISQPSLSSSFKKAVTFSAMITSLTLLPGLATTALYAQAPQTAPAQQPGNPPLTIDRDPVPSPDPDPVPGKANAEQAPETSAGSLSKGPGGKYTLRQDAYEVRLNATVLDGSGRSVLDLTKDAFHVYEDGVPQTVASFRHEDLPVSLGILIDSSGSMYDKRTAVDEASLDLVKLSNPADEAFLVDFS